MEDKYYKHLEPYFGHWIIEKKLGQGASGKVFLVSMPSDDSEFGKTYSALKVITVPDNESEIPSILAENNNTERVEEYYRCLVDTVENEIKLVNSIGDSDHIVKYYESSTFKHENSYGWDVFIRMECLNPLIHRMNDIEFTDDDIITLGIDICDALIACETVGLIHRDIKPENIFITDDGRYKLGDFGIARITNQTEVGVSRKGTAEYMAPELYRMEPCSKTVDIYSLGIVMYKLLNNYRSPFLPAYPEPVRMADREEALVKRICGGVITPPMHGSKELKNIVLTACAYNRTDRFKSASDMKAALEAIRPGEPEEAIPQPSPAKRINKLLAIIPIILLVLGYMIFPKSPSDIIGLDEDFNMFLGDNQEADLSVEPWIYKDEPVTIASSDNKIISIDGSKISAEALGTSELTMTAKGYSESINVTVLPRVSEITGIDNDLYLYEGYSIQLEPALVPAAGYKNSIKEEDIEYSVADKNVVTVTDDGILIAISEGTTSIKLAAGGCAAEYNVTVLKRVIVQEKKTKNQRSKKAKSNKKDSFVDDTYF